MQIIGQNEIKNFISGVTLDNCPHFIMYCGGKRSGKSFITDKLAQKLGIQIVHFGHKVDSVRHAIDTMYAIKEPMLYVCDRLDDMSVSAKNSLLKVTEETPRHAYVVLHSNSGSIATLNSRATIFRLKPYSVDEFLEFCECKKLNVPEPKTVLFNSCASLGEVEYWVNTNKFQQTYELAVKVLDYINEVSTVNAFKLLTYLALSKDSEGIDPVFFLTVVLNLYLYRQGDAICGDIIVCNTIEALRSMKNEVLSKTGIMNRWVLNMMKEIDERC